MSATRFLLALSLLLPFVFSSCDKVTLPSDESESTEGGGTTKPDIDPADILTITEAFERYTADTLVAIQAYIVGYGESESRSFVTGVPSEPRACLVLADTPTAEGYALPVNIGTPSSKSRQTLDLYAHPENLGRRLLVVGTLTSYYGTLGIKKLSYYQLSDAAPSDPHNGSTETPTLGGEGEDTVFDGR